jgi:putative membrane protein
MTKTTKTIFSGAFALLVGLAANMALAAEGDNFVDEASAKGMAEIETARMALDKGTSEDVKQFAQMMIDDHTKANQELAQLAQQKDLEMSDEATLMDKAKAMILKLRDGENFDEAYANNQVVAHEQTIELYQEYVERGENADLKQFAEKTLPKLEEHLTQAKDLQAKHGGKN